MGVTLDIEKPELFFKWKGDPALEFNKAKGRRAWGKNVVKGNRNGDGGRYGGIDGGKYWMGLREAGQEEGEKVWGHFNDKWEPIRWEKE